MKKNTIYILTGVGIVIAAYVLIKNSKLASKLGLKKNDAININSLQKIDEKKNHWYNGATYTEYKDDKGRMVIQYETANMKGYTIHTFVSPKTYIDTNGNEKQQDWDHLWSYDSYNSNNPTIIQTDYYDQNGTYQISEEIRVYQDPIGLDDYYLHTYVSGMSIWAVPNTSREFTK